MKNWLVLRGKDRLEQGRMKYLNFFGRRSCMTRESKY